MLIFIGVAAVVLTEEEKSFRESAGGYSFCLASELRKRCPEVGFFASLSSDIPGRCIIDSLVERRIFFDPDLIDPSAPSYIRFVSGDESCDISSLSAPVSLQEEQLVTSLSTNSDVKAVHLSAEGLFYQPLFSSSLSAASFHNPKPVIIVDPASASFDHSKDEARYARQLREAVSSADLLLLEDGDLECAGLTLADIKTAYVFFKDDSTVFSNGLTIDKKLSKADVLSVLVSRELFGGVTSTPAFQGFDDISEGDFS